MLASAAPLVQESIGLLLLERGSACRRMDLRRALNEVSRICGGKCGKVSRDWDEESMTWVGGWRRGSCNWTDCDLNLIVARIALQSNDLDYLV